MAHSAKEIASKKKKNLISASIRQVVKNPGTVINPKAWQKLAKKISGAADGTTWKEDKSRKGIKSREYSNYDEYLEHQKSKIDKKGEEYLKEYQKLFHEELLKRLKMLEPKLDLRGKTALCLAARLGTEVRSFIDAGCFALGIDLNPGKENKYVVAGDFHKLQFADGTVDLAFTNSFDHVFDKDRVIAEIMRVFKKKAYFIIEIANQFGAYESLAWDDPEELIKVFTDKGFKIVDRSTFKYPWEGIQVVFSYEK